MKVIRLRDYGPRMRTAVHAQQVHDQIAQALKASSRVRLDFADIESVGETFLDRSLGARCDGVSVACVRALQSECRGEHRQGVPPSRTDSRGVAEEAATG